MCTLFRFQTQLHPSKFLEFHKENFDVQRANRDQNTKDSHHESILQICITEVHTDVAQLAHVLFFPEQFKSVEVQLLFLWTFTLSKYSFRFALIAEDVLNIIYKVNTKIKRRAGKFIPKQQFQG